MLKIGVLASGRGTNLQAIIAAINSGYLEAVVCCLITDNNEAYAIEIAKRNNIPAVYVNLKEYGNKKEFETRIKDELKEKNAELVVLAGFMRIIGKTLLDAFPMKMMRINPAILPSFKGLEGQKQAHRWGVKIAGCTVHFVDENMDSGPIIIQGAVKVKDNDSIEELSKRILTVEHKIYPMAIKLFSQGRLNVCGRCVKIKDEASDNDNILIHPHVD
ncbi:phosphoribosylglycinamide formyltransferase [Candidatus Magnetoovum chiemensis]|nr:phosphoribosylglycinamide formyltransferase [Candidatus Magnetoovum chiemensis]